MDRRSLLLLFATLMVPLSLASLGSCERKQGEVQNPDTSTAVGGPEQSQAPKQGDGDPGNCATTYETCDALMAAFADETTTIRTCADDIDWAGADGHELRLHPQLGRPGRRRHHLLLRADRSGRPAQL